MIAEVTAAAGLGLLTAISPCPLATNIAAVSYVGRHAEAPGRTLRGGLAYIAGRTLCYIALAALLAAGLLAAASTSATLSRIIGLFVGPVLIVAGAMLLQLIPMPTFGGGFSRIGEKLAQRGDGLGAFLLGVVFALSFCPSSAAIFFGSLLPLAAEAESVMLVPSVYGITTGLPVLVFAVIVAGGGHGLGKAFDRLKAVERCLRVVTGVILIGVGLFLTLRTNFGL
jgi:cytochrome c biogenesis protein CcdA